MQAATCLVFVLCWPSVFSIVGHGRAPYDVKYELYVQTGTETHSGTNGDVTVMLYGTEGKSSLLEIDTRNHNDLETGSKDRYEFWSYNIGPTMTHLNFCFYKRWLECWKLDYIQVRYTKGPSEFKHVFRFNGWPESNKWYSINVNGTISGAASVSPYTALTSLVLPVLLMLTMQ